MAAKYILGVTTLQMNKDHDYGGVIANQLATLDHLGIFKEPLAKPPEELPRLVDYRDASQDLHLRARAYLHANCAHCHRKWGGGNAEFELHASIPLTATKAVNTPPGQGAFRPDRSADHRARRSRPLADPAPHAAHRPRPHAAHRLAASSIKPASTCFATGWPNCTTSSYSSGRGRLIHGELR